MKKERRWIKSVIAASLQPEHALPWQRDAKCKPASLRAVAAPQMLHAIQATQRPVAIAAR
jgi:hypothetical protein